MNMKKERFAAALLEVWKSGSQSDLDAMIALYETFPLEEIHTYFFAAFGANGDPDAERNIEYPKWVHRHFVGRFITAISQGVVPHGDMARDLEAVEA
jgi:hypothetical protein